MVAVRIRVRVSRRPHKSCNPASVASSPASVPRRHLPCDPSVRVWIRIRISIRIGLGFRWKGQGPASVPHQPPPGDTVRVRVRVRVRFQVNSNLLHGNLDSDG